MLFTGGREVSKRSEGDGRTYFYLYIYTHAYTYEKYMKEGILRDRERVARKNTECPVKSEFRINNPIS